MTRKREAPPSGGSQRGSRPKHAAPQTLRFKAGSSRSCRRRRGEAASIARRAEAGEGVGRAPPGGEAGEGRAGGGGANASQPPCPRPPGALRRPTPRHGATTGAPGSLGGRLRLSSARPPGARVAALSIRARRQQLVRARSVRLARSTAERRPPTRRRSPLRSLPSSGFVRRIAQRFTGTLHYEPRNSVCAGQPGVIASVQMGERRLQELVLPGCPPWESREAASTQDLNTFALGLSSLILPVVIPVKLLFHGH